MKPNYEFYPDETFSLFHKTIWDVVTLDILIVPVIDIALFMVMGKGMDYGDDLQNMDRRHVTWGWAGAN